MIKLFIEILSYLKPNRKRQLILMVFSMLLGGLSDAFSLAAILPFLGVLSNPAKLWELHNVQKIALNFGINSPDQLLIPCTVLFAISAVFASFFRIFNLWFTGVLSAKIGNDLSSEAYSKTLNKPYNQHLDSNSSEIINVLTYHMSALIDVINYILLFLSSCFIIFSIVLGLLLVDWLIASTSAIIFTFLYGSIILYLRVKISNLSKTIDLSTQAQVKYVQEGLGAIRDVIIDDTSRTFVQSFKKADQTMRLAIASSRIYGGSPRYIIEGLGLIFISTIALVITLNGENSIGVIPLLGTLALGAQRLLPAMQQGYNAWVHTKAGMEGFKKVKSILDLPKPKFFKKDNKFKLKFLSFIKVDNISFKYSGSDLVLKNISFLINKGQRVGITGKTGSGKSTLTDILLGLLEPTSGQILLDNKKLYFDEKSKNFNLDSWRNIIAHVPQTIYLSDSSIYENIAFGIEPNFIDKKKVLEVSKKAQIYDFIKDLPEGFNTKVGERGVKLSGGQRQRVGIARALYKNAEILIFDEATSALDNKTENEVMKSIYDLNKDLTLIMVAHRLNTLEKCDFIINLNKGLIT